MDDKGARNFFVGIIGGILPGAIIDNMAIGLLAGMAVAFGLIRFGGGKGA